MNAAQRPASNSDARKRAEERTAENDAAWCPLCYDPDGAHLVGTVHTYGPECERRATVAEIAARVIPPGSAAS